MKDFLLTWDEAIKIADRGSLWQQLRRFWRNLRKQEPTLWRSIRVFNQWDLPDQAITNQFSEDKWASVIAVRSDGKVFWNVIRLKAGYSGEEYRTAVTEAISTAQLSISLK